MSKPAAEILQKFYLQLRDHNTSADGTPITARQLESLVRLAAARARLDLREEITAQDALVLLGKKVSPEKDLALKHPILSISPLKNRNNIESQKLMSKPLRKDPQLSLDQSFELQFRRKTTVVSGDVNHRPFFFEMKAEGVEEDRLQLLQEVRLKLFQEIVSPWMMLGSLLKDLAIRFSETRRSKFCVQ
ncbi:hypothetical protein F0562_015679 [Nyssa sinensis]|uniref:DNA helicase n=1 Tax=Nyssa sinensis TaxID=561372 RepID=A0A5J4ZI25_9ASTE|nr:hypothetical protein F0562_015679 [Nyssa sinensis]